MTGDETSFPQSCFTEQQSPATSLHAREADLGRNLSLNRKASVSGAIGKGRKQAVRACRIIG